MRAPHFPLGIIPKPDRRVARQTDPICPECPSENDLGVEARHQALTAPSPRQPLTKTIMLPAELLPPCPRCGAKVQNHGHR